MNDLVAWIDLSSLSVFHLACLAVAVGMLLWDTVEVGRNDAANLINAVFGARVLSRRRAVLVAGVAVVAGAVLSSDVIDTARKGIFDPTEISALDAALTIYISVYIVDTVLLFSYSAFGMPVSTTATVVFSLLGG
ncbi:MAG: inorganic phosphate transporter, partial [Planctomycetes bacterium]|nr:inorganic phosphate transporter [Planctomycetota bacterium]